jgi:hypothetical protein
MNPLGGLPSYSPEVVAKNAPSQAVCVSELEYLLGHRVAQRVHGRAVPVPGEIGDGEAMKRQPVLKNVGYHQPSLSDHVANGPGGARPKLSSK